MGTSSTGSLSSLSGTSSSAIFAQTIPPLSLSVAQGIDVHCACFPVGWRLWLGIAAAETMARLASTRKKMTSLANNDDLMTINLSVCLWAGRRQYILFFFYWKSHFRKWQESHKGWQKHHKGGFPTCLRRCVHMCLVCICICESVFCAFAVCLLPVPRSF